MMSSSQTWLWGFPVSQSADLQGDGDDIPLLRPRLVDGYYTDNGGEQSNSHSYLRDTEKSDGEAVTLKKYMYISTQTTELPQITLSPFLPQTVFGPWSWFSDSIFRPAHLQGFHNPPGTKRSKL